jgi:hypothetical protein
MMRYALAEIGEVTPLPPVSIMSRPRIMYVPAVKKVGPIMRVQICMRKAERFVGQEADQVRPAQPMSSAVGLLCQNHEV